MANLRMTLTDAQNLFGATFNGCNLYVFKGTPPTDFVTPFSSLSTRLSDVLINLRTDNPTYIGSFGSGSTTTARYLVGTSSGSSASFSNGTGNIGVVTRSSNVVTVNLLTAHGFLPNQQITITSTAPGPNIAEIIGTWTISSVPSATSFTFSQTGSNNTDLARYVTVTMQQVAIASGTASWFCLCGGGAPSTAFTSVRAVVGTVGAAGSGADLEVASTTVVSGSQYLSAGFYLNVPVNWTF